MEVGLFSLYGIDTIYSRMFIHLEGKVCKYLIYIQSGIFCITPALKVVCFYIVKSKGGSFLHREIEPLLLTL